MKLLLFLDQNLRSDTTQFLRDLGYDVVDVRARNLNGASDQIILQAAQTEKRALVTFNGDFGDILVFPPGNHYGIIRLRIHPQTLEVVHPVLQKAFEKLTMEKIKGKLVTITSGKIRIRS